MKMHIKTGDTVVLLAGVEKGKTGKVIEVFPKTGLLVVEGIGMHKKHQRPRREGQKGQIIDRQHPINASKVMNIEVQKKRQERAAAKNKKKPAK